MGGRIGYIIFYNFAYYLTDPFKMLAVWEGGMSFHGGLIGAAIGLVWSTCKFKIPFLPVADIVTSIAPIGLFFTRIGNFINGELYGRIANSFCLHFPTDPANCRYPSQLLQSLLEGLILFIIMQIIIRKTRSPGLTSGCFLILYGIFRSFAELFREPDPQIGFLPGGITQGQPLSFFAILSGAVLIIYLAKTKVKNIGKALENRSSAWPDGRVTDATFRPLQPGSASPTNFTEFAPVEGICHGAVRLLSADPGASRKHTGATVRFHPEAFYSLFCRRRTRFCRSGHQHGLPGTEYCLKRCGRKFD